MTFTATSSEPYDQCFYFVLPETGDEGKAFSDYELARNYWMERHGWNLRVIMVMTRDEVEAQAHHEKTHSSGTGFGS